MMKEEPVYQKAERWLSSLCSLLSCLEGDFFLLWILVHHRDAGDSRLNPRYMYDLKDQSYGLLHGVIKRQVSYV